MIATGHISNVLRSIKLANSKKRISTQIMTTEKALFSHPSQIPPKIYNISRPLLDVDFTINLTQAREFIDRFYHIIQTKPYTFHISTLLISISDKITVEKRHSFPKIKVFDEKTAPDHTFPSSDLQCLPPGDPRILCAYDGSISSLAEVISQSVLGGGKIV